MEKVQVEHLFPKHMMTMYLTKYACLPMIVSKSAHLELVNGIAELSSSFVD